MLRCTVLLIALSLTLTSASCGQERARIDASEAATLMADVRWLSDDARNGRRTGTEDAAAVREWIADRLAEAGLEPRMLPFDTGNGLAHANVMATVPGIGDGDRVIVVTAHYDHLGRRSGTVYNGADDNASGTAALLALAAELVADPPLGTVILVALDGEEAGLLGARAFVAHPPVPPDRIALNVNLDMVSRSDAGELYAAGTFHHPELRAPLERVAASAPVHLLLGHDDPALGGDDWTGQSDHAAFHAAGIPFVYFGVEDHEDYHRPTDDADRIRPEFFRDAVETVVMAVYELDRFVAGSAG